MEGVHIEVKTFVDESGTMSKVIDEEHKYFIIALIHADDYERLYKIFTRARLKILTPELKVILKETKEIKATQLFERQKQKIYEDMVRLSHDFEIGIIVVDTTELPARLRENKARCFNYVLRKYFEKYPELTNFNNPNLQVSLVIDNQNIARKGIYTLQEYLNTELYINKLYEQEFKVSYRDSKSDNLIQFADYVCNTVLRDLNGNIDARFNLKILEERIVKNKFYFYPEKPITEMT
ncbi:MAG: DUF3800 domain-containing protein [Turicibacter sp.]